MVLWVGFWFWVLVFWFWLVLVFEEVGRSSRSEATVGERGNCSSSR